MPALIRPPSPRAHLRGTCALLERVASLWGSRGEDAGVAALMRFVDRPHALPAQVAPELVGLKYDAYVTARGADGGLSWGVAVADRYEGSAMLEPARRLLQELPGDYAFDAALALRDRLAPDTPLAVAVGFDAPGRPPRVKVYAQEDPWNTGLGTCGALGEWVAEVVPGAMLPEWCAERAVGVAALTLRPDGSRSLKVYVGGESPEAAAAGAPEAAQRLARQLARDSPLSGGWYYLTVRVEAAAAPSYTINKIYNAIQDGFTVGQDGARAAWADVERLFAGAGTMPALSRLYDTLRGSGVVALPTATALEGGGRQTDVYLGAWQVRRGSGGGVT